jgi:hypothetical protein
MTSDLTSSPNSINPTVIDLSSDKNQLINSATAAPTVITSATQSPKTISKDTFFDDTLWLGKDQAAVFSNRDRETISKWVRKKSLVSNCIKIKYVPGRRGKEVRIFRPSLELHLESLKGKYNGGVQESSAEVNKPATPNAETIAPAQNFQSNFTRAYDEIQRVKAENEWRKAHTQAQEKGSQMQTKLITNLEGQVSGFESQITWLQERIETVLNQRNTDQTLLLRLQNDYQELLTKYQNLVSNQHQQQIHAFEQKARAWSFWPFSNKPSENITH